jgi:hypothetical protein
MINENDLKSFLLFAKLATYASTKKPKKYTNGQKIYKYSNGSMIYKDIYYGNVLDAGLEVVFDKNFPIWSMSYRGGMTNEIIDSKTCFKFLMKSLSNLSIDFPVRGPSEFRDSDFVYYNFFDGTIFDFIGYEEIYFNNEKIYFKKYIGGLFKFRENPIDATLYNSVGFLFEPNKT